MHGQAAVHEVVDVQRATVGREGHALGCATRREAADLAAGQGVVHHDLAVALERGEEVHALVAEERAADHAGVVVVDAAGSSSSPVARSMRDTMARTVVSKVNWTPSRALPRLMLSCFDGTQICVPSGEMAGTPR